MRQGWALQPEASSFLVCLGKAWGCVVSWSLPLREGWLVASMFLSGQLLCWNKISPCGAGANILTRKDAKIYKLKLQIFILIELQNLQFNFQLQTESRHCRGWCLLAAGAEPPQHRKHELPCGQRGEAGSVPLPPAAVCKLHCGGAWQPLVPQRMRGCRRWETDF